MDMYVDVGLLNKDKEKIIRKWSWRKVMIKENLLKTINYA